MVSSLSALRGDPASPSVRRWVAVLSSCSPGGKTDEVWSSTSTVSTLGHVVKRWLAASHKDVSYRSVVV